MTTSATSNEAMNRARLGTIIKSARDIMRKDAGLNGDLDRLPLLSWLLFLRAFDAMEADREIIETDAFRPAMSSTHQWRTWAAKENFTGKAFIDFVNEELLPYLLILRATRQGIRVTCSGRFSRASRTEWPRAICSATL